MRAETLAKAASAWRTCIAVVALVCVAAGVAAAQGAITGIDVANKADRVVITVQGDRALSMTPLVSSSGKYVGFQFPHRLAAKGRLVGIHSGRIHNVRYSSFRNNPPATRIVLNTSSHVDYSTERSPDRKRLVIHVMKLRSAAVPKPDAAAQAPAIKPLPAIPASDPRPVRVASASVLPISALPIIAPEPAVAEPEVRVRGVSEVATSEPREPALGEPRIEVVQTAQLGGAAPLSRGVSVVARVPVTQPSAQPERKVSLNFLGADINDVLKALSVQSGHNIVASKDVTGNVTVSLNSVTVDQALDYVAKLSGYTYTRENDTYLVAAKTSLKELAGSGADTKTEMIKLSYTKADDVIALVKARFPEVDATKIGVETTGKVGLENKGGKQGIALRNNLLVLTGPADRVDEARELVQKFEDTFKVQSIESKRAVYRIKHVDPGELAEALTGLIPGVGVSFAPSEGFKLIAPKSVSIGDTGSGVELDNSDMAYTSEYAGQSAQDQTGLFGTTGSQANTSKSKSRVERVSRPTAILIVGREDDVNRALELAAELDVRSPQIKIDAKITSLTESGQKKLGVSWDWGSFTLLEGFTDFDKATIASPGAGGPGDLNTANVRDARNKFFRQPWNVSAALDALFKDGNGELLASPSLVCLDGKPGVFFVGDEVTYIQRIEVTPTGQNIVTDTKQVGVQLRAVGSVSADGYITLNLHPEVSVLKLSVEQGVSLPIVARRFTDHVVRVKAGQTIVIGGLIRNDEISEMSKVPVVGDLPILGHLFRHKDKTKDRTEVVMFITASVLTD